MMRLFGMILVIAFALGGYSPPLQAAQILIRHAEIANGRDAALTRGDVRIKDDRIVAIGRLRPARGETVIDAKGLVLAPGFIDTHSHHEEGLAKHLDALQLLSEGVTTIVAGQDGDSVRPVAKLFAERTAAPAAINIASYSGHGALRAAVMGADYKRNATPDEIAKMRALLAEDMKAGALGLSSGLEYDPGIYSSHAEVLELAKEAASHGGRYISHMRSEDRHLWEAIDELIVIGREAKLPVQISHAKLAMTDWWGQADRYLAMLDKARAEGVDVTLDIYPYTGWQATLTVLWPDRNFDDRLTTEFILKHLAPPEGLLISDAPDHALIGKTVAQIAASRGTDPATTAERQAAISR
jgi:N-acyl-D-amino-acid deacylase